jgi:phage repressor protein C with HTH and peptisase S24 domain
MSRPIRRGDVVVVRAGTETLVKRVSRVERTTAGDGQVVVAGDNRPSYDSEVFGPVASDAVIGRVVKALAT